MTSERAATVFPAPMRIAILGVGAIGSAFAFQLAVAGRHNVTAIARPDSLRLQQLQRDGAIVNTDGERAAVQVAELLDIATPYDLVVVTLQAQQVAAVLKELQRSVAKSILFMFNNFQPEQLREAVGPDRCSFGMPFVQATVDENGRYKATIGAGGQKSKIGDQNWVDLFAAAGLPAIFEPNILLWLRCHAPLGAAFESVCFTAKQRGAGASWGDCLRITRGMQESFTLIQRLGYRIYPAAKSLLHASPVTAVAAMLWFVSRIPSFRNLLATGVNECRALVSVMVAAAAVATPAVRVDRIRAMSPPAIH